MPLGKWPVCRSAGPRWPRWRIGALDFSAGAFQGGGAGSKRAPPDFYPRSPFAYAEADIAGQFTLYKGSPEVETEVLYWLER